ncbi:MAG: cyclophilin-like fold protein [Deltaproteobacteria bacterium]|nr:cyclophilin-like fold protein [Deltaproteobacteria bacterium]
MPTPIKIIIGKADLHAELFDSPCAKQIIDHLPIEARPDEWGDEFYLNIPVKAPLDDTATIKVKVGDIGYWPLGNAMAIFFGRTPMSTGSDPVPASAVNLVGRILDDATILKQEKGATKIRIEKTDL